MPINCIICGVSTGAETVEHIIPRSLGNLHYVLPKGIVCGRCNNRFAQIENRVLSSPLFIEERRQLKLLRDNEQQPTSELNSIDVQMFVAKMVFEGLYLSRHANWVQLPTSLGQMLSSGVPQTDAGYTLNIDKFIPVPRWIERFRLMNNQLSLRYARDGDMIIGQFECARIVLTVRIA